ncbi:MAG: hypothetical protein PHD53_00070 [Methylococcales bacterium]|nr:hypothetical protein [Methylococcales bacterium]
MKATTKPTVKKSTVFAAVDAIAIRVFSALINHIHCPKADNCTQIIEIMHAITGGGKSGGTNGGWLGDVYVKSPRLNFEIDGFKLSVIDDTKSLYCAWLKLSKRSAMRSVSLKGEDKIKPLPSVNAAAIELAEGYLLDGVNFESGFMSYDFESLQSLNDIAPNVLCLISASKDELGLGIKGKDGAYYPRYENENGLIKRVKINSKFLPVGSVADFIASKLEPVTVVNEPTADY